jgi:glycosyltransferase involved in cell wall biosynthesis
MLRGESREGAKDVLRKRLLNDARDASAVLVYSEFVRDCLLRNHDIHATVLYPPIDDFAGRVPKEHAILSVGRIFRGLYNDKRYDVMIKAFRRLCDGGGASGWEYWIAGSCGVDEASQRYLQQLQDDARGYPIRFIVNASYAELGALYARADLFWHAAGFGVDDRREPQRTEHFGMSTVEAMSASCIPVVVNNGGQREIVTHGVNGFLWDTIDQLVDQTRMLIDDPSGHEPTRAKARMRFKDFDRTHFAERLHLIVHRLGTPP